MFCVCLFEMYPNIFSLQHVKYDCNFETETTVFPTSADERTSQSDIRQFGFLGCSFRAECQGSFMKNEYRVAFFVITSQLFEICLGCVKGV